MNRLTTSIALCFLAAAALPGLAQETGTTPAPTAPKASAAELIGQLGSESYRQRLEAERELRGLGDQALDALRTAAAESKDPEVQWRARRLVRQIERGEGSGLEQRGDRGQQDPVPAPRGRNPFGGLEGLDERFDRLFGELERDFRMDIPRGRFFQDDFFRDLQAQMDDLRARMNDALEAGGAIQQGRGMSMQVGPDGVRVEIKTKDAEGKDDVELYEAKDLETFRTKYPGVLEQNGLGGGFRFQWGPGDQALRGFLGADPRLRAFDRDWTRGFDFSWPRLPGEAQPEAPEAEPAPAIPEDRRLGVLVQDLSPEARALLGVDEGVGLQVQEVQGGTLAERLGLRAGDIVLQIAGRDIRGVADVQEALRSVATGEQVEVTVHRRGESKQLTARKGGKAPAAETEGPRPLRRRGAIK